METSITAERASAQVLDREQIDGLIEAAGANGAREILNAFWKSTDTLISTLREQLAANNFAEASKTAHALKGSALNVGAMKLSCSARSVEDACKAQDSTGALQRLSCAENECEETRAALNTVLAAAA